MTFTSCRTLTVIGLALSLLTLFSVPAEARFQRDHLTDQETEAVRQNQELDKRIAVFVKAADRRLLVLTDPAGAAAKVPKKELELYGPLPTGTRAELLNDMAGILDEASDKIDDVAFHDESSPLLMKALKKLNDAAIRYLGEFKTIGAAAKSNDERFAAERAAEVAQTIIDGAKEHGL
jgi:hypothetical protein